MTGESAVKGTRPNDSTTGESKKHDAPAVERLEVVFVLHYDAEITYLVNEGVIRSALLPSGFKEN
jgi:hypothetical protein